MNHFAEGWSCHESYCLEAAVVEVDVARKWSPAKERHRFDLPSRMDEASGLD